MVKGRHGIESFLNNRGEDVGSESCIAIQNERLVGRETALYISTL